MKGAVKDYGIPKRTLMRQCRGKVAQPGEENDKSSLMNGRMG